MFQVLGPILPTWEIWMDLLAVGKGLAKPWSLQPSGELPENAKVSLSLPSLCAILWNKQKNLKNKKQTNKQAKKHNPLCFSFSSTSALSI